MNERIQELLAQSGLHPYYDAQEAHIKKFAELLIKRCGQVLVDNTPVVNLVEDWDKGYDRAMNDCIHHIYGHFGLEE